MQADPDPIGWTGRLSLFFPCGFSLTQFPAALTISWVQWARLGTTRDFQIINSLASFI